jgi:hypothetical protein
VFVAVLIGVDVGTGVSDGRVVGVDVAVWLGVAVATDRGPPSSSPQAEMRTEHQQRDEREVAWRLAAVPSASADLELAVGGYDDLGDESIHRDSLPKTGDESRLRGP